MNAHILNFLKKQSFLWTWLFCGKICRFFCK